MASSDLGSVDRKVLDDLYEDIHWLILVSGQQQDRNIMKNTWTHTAFVRGYTVSPSSLNLQFSSKPSVKGSVQTSQGQK